VAIWKRVGAVVGPVALVYTMRWVALPRVLPAGDVEYLHALFAIQFPGYGMGKFGQVRQADGSVLTGSSIEIPMARSDRCFMFGDATGSTS